MSPSSRHIRPVVGPGLRLQARDREVLRQVAHYRLLSSEHLHILAFGGVSRRLVNRRLRQLWASGFLERHYLPELRDGLAGRSRRPVYALSRAGAAVLADADGRDVDQLRRATRVELSDTWTARHDIVATDLLVAVETAARGGCDIDVASSPEHRLRRALSLHLRRVGNRLPGLVPDGAFRVGAETFLIEVVRAGAKGGNRSLRAKMQRYVELNRQGFFKTAFGFDRLRAVLFVTTSPKRATTILQLAGGLMHGRNLFWATSYERKVDLGVTFEPTTVLGPIWRDTNGSSQSLAPAARSPAPGASIDNI
jgi:hypothetical protein